MCDTGMRRGCMKHIGMWFLLLFSFCGADILETEEFLYDVTHGYLVWNSSYDNYETPLVYKGQKFRIYRNNEILGTCSVDGISQIESIACTHWGLSFNGLSDNWKSRGHVIAIPGTHDARSRKYQEIDPKSPVYTKIFREYLKDNGVENPVVSIDKIVKTDIQNDGTDEVLIVAYNVENMYFPKSGEYSLIILREVVNGEVRTKKVCGTIYTEESNGDFAGQNDIIGVLDYDGDTVNEIIVSESNHAYFGTVVYEVTHAGASIDIREGTCVD